MKVRWTGGSLRVRITPGELDAVVRGEPLHERLDLPGGGWRIRVEVSGDRPPLRWEDGAAIVALSPADVARLAEPEREGVYPQSGRLRVIVEKDFPCAHPRAAEAREPEGERFAPTAAFLARKGRG